MTWYHIFLDTTRIEPENTWRPMSSTTAVEPSRWSWIDDFSWNWHNKAMKMWLAQKNPVDDSNYINEKIISSNDCLSQAPQKMKQHRTLEYTMLEWTEIQLQANQIISSSNNYLITSTDNIFFSNPVRQLAHLLHNCKSQIIQAISLQIKVV